MKLPEHYEKWVESWPSADIKSGTRYEISFARYGARIMFTKLMEDMRPAIEALREANARTRFALQCMIINKNGAVPGMSDEQVFANACEIRDASKDAEAKILAQLKEKGLIE